MKTIKVRDKEFELFIREEEINKSIDRVAKQIESELKDENPLFICVLNGSFMFASELMKRINIPCEITFVRVSSYDGTQSTGQLKEVYGLEMEVENRTIVIVEDIVDTGNTMKMMLKQFDRLNPKSIKIATLLFKPKALLHPNLRLEYVAMEIPSDFIVGYGLDYDGHGRNYPDIYKIKK